MAKHSRNKMKKMEFVKNKEKYHEFIRNLRNDGRIKKWLIQQGYITKEQQKKYMKKHNGDYYLCLYEGKPAGYIGVIEEDVRIVVHPDYQNKGVGSFLLANMMNTSKRLQAKIKIGNISSIKLFEKAGFKLKYHIYEYGNED